MDRLTGFLPPERRWSKATIRLPYQVFPRYASDFLLKALIQ
jgi:hypothetical protein